MKRTILAAVLLIVGAVIGSLWTRPVQAGQPCTVPKDWGGFRTMAPGYNGVFIFAFEAADGTIRTVPAGCKTPAQPIDTITRN